MREIKFKYIFSDGKEFKSTVLSLAAIENGALKSFINNIPSSFELVAVCQFTGLLYKNDDNFDETFDGTIIKCNINSQHKENIIGFIEYKLGNWWIYATDGSMYYFNSASNVKVLGNRFENKELLC